MKPSKTPLREPIANAIDSFHEASMQRMAAANAADEPTKSLFHYTSEAALYGIIESETFWFTSIYHMDDTEELTFGYGVAQAVLQEAVDHGDALTKMFCEPLADAEDLEKVKKIFEFYSVSFGERDDPKQWEKYAGNSTGVSFGLAPEFFKPLATKVPAPEEMVFLGKVAYGDANARARHVAPINEAIATIQGAQKSGAIRDGKDAKSLFEHIAAEMTVETLWNSVTTKDDSWKHQNETRLLALNNLLDPHLTIHNAKDRPRVELPQPLLKRFLSEVMIGANADPGVDARVRAFLDRHGLAHVPVVRAVMR